MIQAFGKLSLVLSTSFPPPAFDRTCMYVVGIHAMIQIWPEYTTQFHLLMLITSAHTICTMVRRTETAGLALTNILAVIQQETSVLHGTARG